MRTAAPRPPCWCRCSATRSDPGLVFTERRDDLRRHAGEISFPGGRRDIPARSCSTTALREAEEEIGLAPAERRGASARCRRSATFVTGYKVHPFVGLIGDGPRASSRTRPRSRRVLALPARRARGGFADAPPGPPRRPDPHPHLRGRGAPDLGRDRADPRRAAGAPPDCDAPATLLDVLLDRDVDQVAPLGPRAVVVLDVVLAEQLVEHEPGVRRALADPAVGDHRLAVLDHALASV